MLDGAQLSKIAEELMKLTRLPGRDGKAVPPLTRLRNTSPVLLSLVSDSLASIGVTATDPEKTTGDLLKIIASSSDEITVKQAGDLLGLTPENVDVKKILEAYEAKHPSDVPERPFRFNRGVRQVIAAQRNGLGRTRNANDEAKWIDDFAAKLFTYLDNEAGKLTKFAREYGYLPPTEEGQAGAQETVGGSQTAEKIHPLTASSYVRRNTYHDLFRQILSSGSKIILLVGQPGMGKSYLAQAVAAEHASDPTNIAVIRARGNNISKADLYTALTAADMDADGVEFGDIAFHLARLVTDERAPEFVLIDGLDDAAILSALLPPLTRSVIVATARFMSRHVGDIPIIRVGLMSAGEAIELIQRHLPITKDGADLLNQKLRGFPLVIRHACPLLASGTLSVAQLSQVLETNPPAFLSEVPSEDNGKLIAVLGEIVESIKTKDPKAFRLLECLVFLQSGFKISQRFLTRYMSDGNEPTPETEAETALIYTQAVRRLQDFSLIEVLDADYLSMHRLTAQVLRMFLNDRIANVTLFAYRRIGQAYRGRYLHELNLHESNLQKQNSLRGGLSPEDLWAHGKLRQDRKHMRDIFSAFLASSEEDRMWLAVDPEEAHKLADLLKQAATQFCQAAEQTDEIYKMLIRAKTLEHPIVGELLAASESVREIQPLAAVRDFIWTEIRIYDS